MRIELRAGTHPVHERQAQEQDVPSLPIPDQPPTRWHPLLAELTAPTEALSVSEASLPRAMRLLHVVITAAEERGIEVGWAAEPRRALEFRSLGHCVDLVIAEVHERRDVLPSPTESSPSARYSWQRVRAEAREVPTGRLRLAVSDGGKSRDYPRRWGDRQSRRVEEKLDQVLGEIKTRLQALEDRRLAQEAALRQRRVDWEAAMADARQAFHENRREAALRQQLQDWQQATQIRDYCVALEAVADQGNVESRAAWITWARRFADRLDPVRRQELEPPEIDPRPEDLRPFLGKGWSPYGPGVP